VVVPSFGVALLASEATIGALCAARAMVQSQTHSSTDERAVTSKCTVVAMDRYSYR